MGAIQSQHGLTALVNLAHGTGILEQLDQCSGIKQRNRGFAASASVTDLMLLMCSGGECVDDIEVMRQDKGPALAQCGLLTDLEVF